MKLAERIYEINQKTIDLVKEAEVEKREVSKRQMVCDRKISDWLHILEITDDLSYHQYARIAKTMREILKERRIVKDEFNVLNEITGLGSTSKHIFDVTKNIRNLCNPDRKRVFKIREICVGTIEENKIKTTEDFRI